MAGKDKIFINYRRSDSGGYAGRLSDSLAAYFGAQRVFRDVTGIAFGHDFERVIDEKLAESGALVVVIGEGWVGATDDDVHALLVENPSRALAFTEPKRPRA